MGDDTLDTLLEAAGYAAGGPGVAVAVSRPDGSASMAARGRIDPHRPHFAPDTVSFTASVSEEIIGACIARTVLDGALDLRVRLRRWLPALPPWADRVRIDHLLHHTSGLPTAATLSQHIARVTHCRWDGPAVLRALASLRSLEFTPGSRVRYCNADYIVLAALVERVVGDLARFARRYLLQPLGMTATTLWRTAGALPPGCAPGHPAGAEPGAWPLPLSIGDGGVWSTVEDLQRWNRALLPGGALDARLRSLLHASGRSDEGRPLDFAWGTTVHRDGAGRLVHGRAGAWPGGWSAATLRLPEVGLAVAALSNSADLVALRTLTDEVVARHAA